MGLTRKQSLSLGHGIPKGRGIIHVAHHAGHTASGQRLGPFRAATQGQDLDTGPSQVVGDQSSEHSSRPSDKHSHDIISSSRENP